eukprot:jgi/Chrpa1/15514/Chrysochromulina_OHIO_Genome00004636-RA
MMINIIVYVAAPSMIATSRSLVPALQLQRSNVARFRCSEQGTYETNHLVVAARKGKIDELTEALGRDGTDVNLAVSCTKIPAMDGATALVWAARQGQLAAVSLLLQSKANVDAATTMGWTSLYVAALNGHENIVEMLVANGASVATALSLGDERTNLNLKRMVGSMARSEVGVAPPIAAVTPPRPQPWPPSPPSIPPPSSPLAVPAAADDAEALPFWKLAQKQAIATPASATAERALSGLSELETLRLRLEWKAPPTKEEQSAADAARQTLFKYRYDRIMRLEAELASGRAIASGRATAAPSTVSSSGPYATPTATTAMPSEGAASVPAASASSAASLGDVLSRIEAVEKASLISRLEAIERVLAKLTSSQEHAKQADPNGYADGYAAGFAAGFTAGRASK